MKNALFYLLFSTSFLIPLSSSALSFRCEHIKDIFFQFKTKDGKTINHSTNSKKDKQKFTLELKVKPVSEFMIIIKRADLIH